MNHSLLPMQVSLVSLNTWKCEGEYPHRLDLIADEIRSQSCDFFLGQEVFDSGSISTEKMLSGKLKYASYYEKARYKEREVGGKLIPSHSGLCVWTDHALSSRHTINLPTAPLDGERISQVFSCEVKGKLIAIINTHLTHLRNESKLRLKQIKTTIDEVNRLCNPDGILFCGDFNANKESPEIKNLISSYGFTDAYPDCPSTHIGGKCVDHIFYYPTHRFSVSKARTILHSSKHEILPSDHFGIHVEINIHTDE